GFEAAGSERCVDQTGDAHAGFVDHAEQQRQLLAAVAGWHGEQHALAFCLVRTEQLLCLRERDISSRACKTRRPRELFGAQTAPEIRMREQRIETDALDRRFPRARGVVAEERDARYFGQHLAVLAALTGEQQAGINELQCQQAISPACDGSDADRSSDRCCARSLPATAAADAGRTSARSSATARR